MDKKKEEFFKLRFRGMTRYGDRWVEGCLIHSYDNVYYIGYLHETSLGFDGDEVIPETVEVVTDTWKENFVSKDEVKEIVEDTIVETLNLASDSLKEVWSGDIMKMEMINLLNKLKQKHNL